MNVVTEADNIPGQLALVAAGMGLALFPISVKDLNNDGIVFRDLKPSVPQTSLGLAPPKPPSELVELFLKVAREVIQVEIVPELHDEASPRTWQ